jgi:hypothetical protein
MAFTSYLRVGSNLFTTYSDKFPSHLAILFHDNDIKRVDGDRKTIYSTTASVIRKRLDFLGFTLKAASLSYEFEKEKEIAGIEDLLKRMSNEEVLERAKFNEYIAHEEKRQDALRAHDFSSWMQSLKDPLLICTVL